jgi:hypothetical protein
MSHWHCHKIYHKYISNIISFVARREKEQSNLTARKTATLRKFTASMNKTVRQLRGCEVGNVMMKYIIYNIHPTLVIPLNLQDWDRMGTLFARKKPKHHGKSMHRNLGEKIVLTNTLRHSNYVPPVVMLNSAFRPHSLLVFTCSISFLHSTKIISLNGNIWLFSKIKMQCLQLGAEN